MEKGEQPPLQSGTEINQQVPAANQVEVREGGFLGDILFREDDQIADGLGNLVPFLGLDKPPAEALPVHLAHGVIQVPAFARGIDGVFVDVGGEYLSLHRTRLLSHHLEQGDGDRVGFFARGAAGHPNPHRRVSRPVLEQFPHHSGLQPFESVGLPEETADADEHVAVEGLQFRRVCFDQVQVVFQRGLGMKRHPAANTALDRGLLVITKIHPK